MINIFVVCKKTQIKNTSKSMKTNTLAETVEVEIQFKMESYLEIFIEIDSQK